MTTHPNGCNPMTITVTDPAMIAALKQAGDHVEFHDAAGELLGRFSQELPYAPPPWVLAKIKTLTPEELAERRKDLSSQSIDEFLEEL